MLDNPAFIVESEDFDASVFMVTRPSLVTVEDHVVGIRHRPLGSDVLAGVFTTHANEVAVLVDADRIQTTAIEVAA